MTELIPAALLAATLLIALYAFIDGNVAHRPQRRRRGTDYRIAKRRRA